MTSEKTYQEVELASIESNKDQPRQYFREASLNELATNIKKHGLLQPLIVRQTEAGKLELVVGERRYRACKLANVTRVTCEVRELTDEAALELSLSENLQREDLTAIEEARAYQRYLDLGFTQQQIADKLDKTRSRIAQMLALLKLSPHIQNLMAEGHITERHGRALLKLEKYCEQFADNVRMACCTADTLIRVWEYDHAPVTFDEAMTKAIKGEGKLSPEAIASLTIELKHIPDHVATRIKGAKLTVNDLEQLAEDLKFAVIRLSLRGIYDFGISILREDVEWLVAVGFDRNMWGTLRLSHLSDLPAIAKARYSAPTRGKDVEGVPA